MSNVTTYRNLNDGERSVLLSNGCSATDWDLVKVADGFDASRVVRAKFVGQVKIGRMSGTIDSNGVEKNTGIYDATIVNCTIGDGVRIAVIGVHLANYTIAEDVCIENVGTIVTSPGTTFGNGVEVEVLNEGGGREVILFNELSAQFAHLMCMHRYQPTLIEKLTAIANSFSEAQRSDHGHIGRGARICSVDEIRDVNIGEFASVCGSSRLCNGTILSADNAKTVVGADVQAEDFIIAEGACVDSASMLTKCFVGQGCSIGRQFSAENSLFFANCEGFHGEAVSLFAGPYSVTHHKSSLLIAGHLSFYNAGSGTNQSNHMYKLGPVHEGKLERGCKTGSFSYMMWPCRVGPFSVVLGKHKRRFDTADFPFSLIEADEQGHCNMVPGLNLTTVGTVRDGAKWPARDRRTCTNKRDRISFDVLSPYTVGRMIEGSDILRRRHEETERSIDSVQINGASVKRVLLRKGEKFYRNGIEIYLLEQIVRRAEDSISSGQSLSESLALPDGAMHSDQWVDISGQLMPRKRLTALVESLTSGEVAEINGFHALLDYIADKYADDEWAWVRHAYQRVFGRALDSLTGSDISSIADEYLKVKSKFLNQVLADAKKEFDDTTGFGYGGTPDDVQSDFDEVRGTFENNKFVKQMQEELASLSQRVSKLKSALSETTS